MPFVDDTHPLFAWRGGGDNASMSYMWQLSFPVPLQQSLALAGDKARLKALALQVRLCESELSSRFEVLLQLCGDWHEPIPLLIQTTELQFVTGYPAFDCPPLQPQTLRQNCCCSGGSAALCSSNCRLSRVTIIGDAAHPMSPFKGQGANQAIIDGVALARALHQSSIGFDTEALGICLGAAAPRYAVHSSVACGSKHDAEVGCGWSRTTSCEGAAVSREVPLAQALQAFEGSMLSRSMVKARCSNDAVSVLHSKGAASAQ